MRIRDFVLFLAVTAALAWSCSTNNDDVAAAERILPVGLNHDISNLRANPGRAAYYINSETGNDDADGRSPNTAWKNLTRIHRVTLIAGDTVRLARGSRWSRQSLFFDDGARGTEREPITIEAYGTGPLPTIENPAAVWDAARDWPAISFTRDSKTAQASEWFRVLDVRVIGAKAPAISLSGHTRNITVAGCEIVGSVMGVSVAGENQRVIGCFVHDGIMAKDEGDPSSDWGANGVGLMGRNNTIAWNHFLRCMAQSKSFGTDGGAIEFFGHDSDTGLGWEYVSERLSIHHNLIEESDCFMEGLGKVNGMTIANNLYRKSRPGPFLFHLNTINDHSYYRVLIAHNTIDCSDSDAGGGWGIIGLLVDWDNPASPNLANSSVAVINNVFITDYTVMSWVNPLEERLVHHNNVIYLVNGGKLSTKDSVWVAQGEILSDPLLKDPARRDYGLRDGSPAIASGSTTVLNYDDFDLEALTVDLEGRETWATALHCGAYTYR
jgi:hypothetical protein